LAPSHPARDKWNFWL